MNVNSLSVPGVLSRANILLLVYVAMIWLSSLALYQYKDVRVFEHDFPGKANQWQDNGVSENISIDSQSISIIPDVAKRTRVATAFDLRSIKTINQYLKVEGRVVSNTIAEPMKAYNERTNRLEESLLYLWFVNESKERLKVGIISELTQTDNDIETSKILAIPVDAVAVNIGFLMRQFQTKHTLLKLKVSLVEKTWLYKITVTFLILVLAVLVIKFIHYSISKRLLTVPVVITAGVAIAILVGALSSGNQLRSLLSPLIGNLRAGDVGLFQGYQLDDIQDMLHFFGFAILSMLVAGTCAIIGYSNVDGILKLFIFALFTEAIQGHSIDRNPSIVDVLIDSAGIATGLLICLSAMFVLSKWRRRNELA